MPLLSGEGGDGRELTTADLVVLSLVSERPMHGYAVVAEYERQEVSDWANVSRAHVYYALKKLAAAGLLVGTRQAGSARGRLVFEITEKGANMLADALASPSWATSRPPTPFTTWLGLSIHARPDDVQSILRRRRNYLEEQAERERLTLAAILADEGERTRIAAAMVSLAIRQFEVEIEWLDSVALPRGLPRRVG